MKAKSFKSLMQDDPTTYEWPCDICGKPFRPKFFEHEGKRHHAPRCQSCAETALLKAIFGKDALP